MTVRYRRVRNYRMYRVGSDGSVWRWVKYKHTWKQLKLTVWEGRYLCVCLCKHNKKKMFLVHRLVLETFKGPCPEGMEARHYPDRDGTNNNLNNLSWASFGVNQRDRVEHNTHIRGTRHPLAKLDEIAVRRIRRLRLEGWKLRELSELFGVSIPIVSRVARNEHWTHVE